MKMFEILIVEIITNLAVFFFYLAYDVIIKIKLTRDRSRRLEVFSKKSIF